MSFTTETERRIQDTAVTQLNAQVLQPSFPGGKTLEQYPFPTEMSMSLDSRLMLAGTSTAMCVCEGLAALVAKAIQTGNTRSHNFRFSVLLFGFLHFILGGAVVMERGQR